MATKLTKITQLTQKQEKFALNFFSGMSQAEAYVKAGYANNASSTVEAHACRLAKNGKVLARVQELKQQAASNRVMSVIERKERLSELAKAKLVDFVDDNGAISRKADNNSAIAELTIEDWRIEGVATDLAPLTSRTKKIRLHNPIQAITELNKMEHIYTEGAVNVENKILVVNVSTDNSKHLTERLTQGERTG